MNRPFRILCLLLFIPSLVFFGCGKDLPPEIPADEDPALSQEGDPAADAMNQFDDPAL